MDTNRFNDFTHLTNSQRSTPLPPEVRTLHRIAEVRRQQSLSSRVLAKRLAAPIQELDRQQSPYCDLLLSQLYRWQAALDVPAAELLVDPGQTLSPGVNRRARLVKLMKSVRSLQQLADSDSLRVLTEQLANQLIEIMPELVDVDSWPVVGKRRSLDDVSALEERVLPDSMLDRTRLPLSDND